MKLEVVKIPSGDVTLAALRYVPEPQSKTTGLVYVHGFTSGKYSLDNLASYLALRGYAGLTFDCVGHKLGGTGGEMRHITQAADNLRDALAWFRVHTPLERAVLIGHSMGAAAVLQVAEEERRAVASGRESFLAGVVCLCMGTEPARGFESVIGQTMLAQRQDYVAGAPALELLTQLNAIVPQAAEGIAGLPALFLAARQDVLVSPAKVEALAALAGPNASATVIEGAHLDAPDRARGTIATWLERQPP